ncbi:MAG: MoaF N-terminal domain-containing protein [Sneathiella sp.]|uniref:MoaF-related domain-containing protein n=1 Tax=Sneathiella sp. TaxID=1964365 RepID=UPI0030012E1B
MICSKIGLTVTAAFVSAALLLPFQVTTPAFAGDETQGAQIKRMNKLTGRTFDYQIEDYKIRAEFLAEDRLRWTYLSAPGDLKGKTADEKLDRRDIHSGIILLSWTEKDGTNVVDVLDLQTMTMHANAVFANGVRFFTKAMVTEFK